MSGSLERICSHRLLPAVAGLESVDGAVRLAEALLAAGLDVMEITLRHPSALGGIAAIAERVPGMCCGAGTILRPEQVRQARDAGARFGVSPGFNPETIRAAVADGWPFIPGVATPGEIERSLALGCGMLKFFPSEPLGGVAFLRSVAGPYGQTGVRFVPMGGITRERMGAYLSLPIVAAVGMSALAPVAEIRAGEWGKITGSVRDLLERAAECG